ncbi:hypothetical protein CVT26_007685 [Gymnopilus dilepis]|uniref:Uncharacterized protein n=1 Tax=Gymnopilus dilepis TaxID=231916 RepID=A0A409X851_9AGAR|nr:hypothetical protein CVT26_007685 [Gymnopilus dilepis]
MSISANPAFLKCSAHNFGRYHFSRDFLRQIDVCNITLFEFRQLLQQARSLESAKVAFREGAPFQAGTSEPLTHRALRSLSIKSLLLFGAFESIDLPCLVDLVLQDDEQVHTGLVGMLKRNSCRIQKLVLGLLSTFNTLRELFSQGVFVGSIVVVSYGLVDALCFLGDKSPLRLGSVSLLVIDVQEAFQRAQDSDWRLFLYSLPEFLGRRGMRGFCRIDIGANSNFPVEWVASPDWEEWVSDVRKAGAEIAVNGLGLLVPSSPSSQFDQRRTPSPPKPSSPQDLSSRKGLLELALSASPSDTSAISDDPTADWPQNLVSWFSHRADCEAEVQPWGRAL